MANSNTDGMTLKANTTYLVFAFTNSASGDSATPSSSVAGLTFNANRSPALTIIGRRSAVEIKRP